MYVKIWARGLPFRHGWAWHSAAPHPTFHIPIPPDTIWFKQSSGCLLADPLGFSCPPSTHGSRVILRWVGGVGFRGHGCAQGLRVADPGVCPVSGRLWHVGAWEAARPLCPGADPAPARALANAHHDVPTFVSVAWHELSHPVVDTSAWPPAPVCSDRRGSGHTVRRVHSCAPTKLSPQWPLRGDLFPRSRAVASKHFPWTYQLGGFWDRLGPAREFGPAGETKITKRQKTEKAHRKCIAK